jgi:hypothetical protein
MRARSRLVSWTYSLITFHKGVTQLTWTTMARPGLAAANVLHAY